MFSFLIFGKIKIISKIGNSSFGNSLYEKINSTNTYLVSFGLNKFDPTFVHYIEEYFNNNFKKIKYRFLKKYEGFFEKKTNNKKKFFSFSRNLRLNKFFNEKNIKKKLVEENKLKNINFLGFDVYIARASDFFLAGIKGMKKDTFFE